MSKVTNNQSCYKFQLGDKVIARWIDGKNYPGQIHQILTLDSYMVLFEDGCQKVVKVNHIEPNHNPVPRTELPFSDARQQRAIHESDICDLIVNCTCGSIEDTGFLIQCDHCLTFQHASCYDVETDADLLDAITCFNCLHPEGIRESCQYKFDHSWLKDATLPNLVTNKDEPVQPNKRISAVNFLLETALECYEVIRGLKSKFALKNKKVHSSEELKCWSKSWLTTDFVNLPAISKIVTPNVKNNSPSIKVKSTGRKKQRSTKRDRKNSKSSHELFSSDLCLSSNADDSNQSTCGGDIKPGDNNIGSMDKMTNLNISNSSIKDGFAMAFDNDSNLDKICQKNLDEHLADINNRLDIKLGYIESRIEELEEWYGPDLDPNDVEANRTEFRTALQNLYSNLDIFKRITIPTKCQEYSADEQSSESEDENEDETNDETEYDTEYKTEPESETDEEYRPEGKSFRKKQK